MELAGLSKATTRIAIKKMYFKKDLQRIAKDELWKAV